MASFWVITKLWVGVSGLTFVVDNFFEFAAVTCLALHRLTLEIRVPSFLGLNWFHVSKFMRVLVSRNFLLIKSAKNPPLIRKFELAPLTELIPTPKFWPINSNRINLPTKRFLRTEKNNANQTLHLLHSKNPLDPSFLIFRPQSIHPRDLRLRASRPMQIQ